MCDLTDAYISGVWHGALGIGFIVAGLLGWPQTRFILTLIFRRKPRYPIGKPVGSLGANAAPFWNQYGVHRSERGFAIAPILYLLGLIGVMGGILFSNNMQLLRSNVVVQNSVTAKSDLQGAANTLSAEGVFSTDGMTLCPPRSTHQTSGDPCASAPIGLTQFGDLPASELAQLPSGYANAASTGSPTEVGVFAAGAGTHMLDPYGHLYIYCRWENPRSNPSAPAFVLLSAADDGILQSTCGSAAAQNDDYLYAMSVGEAINRAALWQATSSNGVTYGATGTQVVIDNSGNITALNLTASSATIANTLTTNGLNAMSMTVTGAAGVGSLSADSANITNALTASSGDFTSLSTGTIDVTGTATVGGTATFSGDVGIGNASPTHTLDVYAYNTTPLYVNTSYGSPAAYFATGNGAAINAVGGGSGATAMFATVASGSSVRAVILIGQPNGNTGDLTEWETGGGTTLSAIKYNGAFSVGTTSSKNMLDVSGSAAIGSGYAGIDAAPANGLIVQGNVGIGFSAPASALDVNGQILASSLTTTGDINAKDLIATNNVNGATGNFTTLNVTNETVTGTLTANNFSFSGTGSASGGNFTNLTATNATITNTLAANVLTASSVTASGTVSGTTGDFTTLNVSGNLTATNANITNNLTANNETTTNSTIGNLTASYAYFNQATFYWPLMWYGTQLLKLTDSADVKLGPTDMSDDSAGSTALGQGALNNVTSSASGDTGAGSFAGTSITNGSVDTAIGAYALSSNAKGSYNTALGASALQNGNTGSYNTAAGASVLQNATGSYNTAIGYDAGSVTLRNGSYNILIGYGADVPTASTTSWLNIGGLLQGSLYSQTLGIGTSSPQATLDVNGEIRAGNTGAACTSANAGAMRYNSSNQTMQYCNGSAWNPFEEACTIGATVGSGICAGQIAGKNLIVAPSGCPASASSASQCAGADLQMWYQNNGNADNNTMTDGGDGVATQTAALAYYVSIGQTAPTANITEYCKSLTIDGKTWHAPSVAELEIAVTAYSNGLLSAANLGTGAYWTANDDEHFCAAMVTFSTGAVTPQNDSYTDEAIRCVTLE